MGISTHDDPSIFLLLSLSDVQNGDFRCEEPCSLFCTPCEINKPPNCAFFPFSRPRKTRRKPRCFSLEKPTKHSCDIPPVSFRTYFLRHDDGIEILRHRATHKIPQRKTHIVTQLQNNNIS